ncbi:MAG: cation:proton antiporter [Myxococcaceae bacterium]|nr:cation:proton antiporter [Myxococcaceae bacterium]
MHGLTPLALLLLQAAVVLLLSRLLGTLGKRFGQPLVIGEVVAGILLGPTVLGALAPSIEAALFPPSSLNALGLVAQLGLMLFMFVVGLDVDLKALGGLGKSAAITSAAGIAVPFALGMAIAPALAASLAPPGQALLGFSLFLGIAMAVTAFPVLARLLNEKGLAATPVGNLALAAAAVGDVAAWCLLAGVVSVVRAESLTGAATTTLAALAYLVALAVVFRPALTRLVRALSPRALEGQGALAAALLLMLLSCFGTELIGIHALFGAFAAGAIIPRERGLAHAISTRLEDLVGVLFLPLFFALSGLRTEIGLVDSPTRWLQFGLLLFLAVAGKFGGVSVAARLSGQRWPMALELGVLMNTRGLMELVVLNVGLDLGVISRPLFAMLVLMALVTTAATSPLLDLLARGRSPATPPPVP